MRFISKLTMAVAAIFFAVSFGSPSTALDADVNDDALNKKVYQVCKKWRFDQGGPMPTDQMQHCTNVLFDEALEEARCNDWPRGCVTSEARERAKVQLGYW